MMVHHHDKDGISNKYCMILTHYLYFEALSSKIGEKVSERIYPNQYKYTLSIHEKLFKTQIKVPFSSFQPLNKVVSDMCLLIDRIQAVRGQTRWYSGQNTKQHFDRLYVQSFILSGSINSLPSVYWGRSNRLESATKISGHLLRVVQTIYRYYLVLSMVKRKFHLLKVICAKRFNFISNVLFKHMPLKISLPPPHS